MTAGRQRSCAAAGGGLATGPALAGDDDKPPGYKIYIDPETGKYTTEDPGAGKDETAELVAASAPVPEAAEGADSGAPYGMLVAVAVIVILAGAALRRQGTI